MPRAFESQRQRFFRHFEVRTDFFEEIAIFLRISFGEQNCPAFSLQNELDGRFEPIASVGCKRLQFALQLALLANQGVFLRDVFRVAHFLHEPEVDQQVDLLLDARALRLSAACHQGSGESEQLVLSFANYEVIVDGARLALLLPEIANFHLDCLRDMPAQFHSQADKKEPFISRLSVRSASDSRETGAQTS